MGFLRRRIYQGAGAILSNAYLQGFATPSLYQGPLKAGCAPVLNCHSCPSALFSCPIGAVQHFAATGSVPLYALGSLAVVGASVGRMTCGYLCPFGFLQDLLFKIRTRKWTLPRWSGKARYGVLVVLALLIPYWTGENWFSKLCPMGTLEAAIPWAVLSGGIRAMVGALFVIKVAILLSFVLASAAVKRPFCRTSCPLGAILSLFNGVSFFRIAWNPATCTDCGECRKICPVDIRPQLEAAGPDCIRCLDCTACPSLKLTTVFDRNPFGAPGEPGMAGGGLAETPAP